MVTALNQSFGRLTVREERGNKCICDCSCGTKGYAVPRYRLTSGNTKSCGCLRRDTSKQRFAKTRPPGCVSTTEFAKLIDCGLDVITERVKAGSIPSIPKPARGGVQYWINLDATEEIQKELRRERLFASEMAKQGWSEAKGEKHYTTIEAAKVQEVGLPCNLIRFGARLFLDGLEDDAMPLLRTYRQRLDRTPLDEADTAAMPLPCILFRPLRGGQTGIAIAETELFRWATKIKHAVAKTKKLDSDRWKRSGELTEEFARDESLLREYRELQPHWIKFSLLPIKEGIVRDDDGKFRKVVFCDVNRFKRLWQEDCSVQSGVNGIRSYCRGKKRVRVAELQKHMASKGFVGQRFQVARRAAGLEVVRVQLGGRVGSSGSRAEFFYASSGKAHLARTLNTVKSVRTALLDQLIDGPIDCHVGRAWAKERGIGEQTLTTARRLEGIKTVKGHWCLPGQESPGHGHNLDQPRSNGKFISRSQQQESKPTKRGGRTKGWRSSKTTKLREAWEADKSQSAGALGRRFGIDKSNAARLIREWKGGGK